MFEFVYKTHEETSKAMEGAFFGQKSLEKNEVLLINFMIAFITS